MPIIRFENENEFVKRLIGKDETAFRVLVDKLKERFYSIAYAILGRKEEAEDAVENTFLEAYRDIAKFRKESSLYSWLYRILVNTSYRKAGEKDFKAETKPHPDSAEGTALKDASIFPGIAELDDMFLRETLLKLPRAYCDVIILRAFENLNYKEIADVLGIKEGTVMSRLYRARALLREYLKKKSFSKEIL